MASYTMALASGRAGRVSMGVSHPPPSWGQAPLGDFGAWPFLQPFSTADGRLHSMAPTEDA